MDEFRNGELAPGHGPVGSGVVRLVGVVDDVVLEFSGVDERGTGLGEGAAVEGGVGLVG